MFNKLKLLKKIYIDIILFLFLYLPPIFNFNIVHILFVISIISILFNIKNYIEFLKKVINKYNVIIYSFILLLCALIFVLGNHDFKILYSNCILIVEAIFISLYIVYYFYKNKFNKKDIVYNLCIIGLFQSLISILMIIFPGFQNWFIELCKNRGFDAVAIEYFRNYRYYGFSSELTFTMPILQVVIAYLLLFQKNTKNSLQKILKYIIIVILLFSAIINARISLIIIIICFICYVLYLIRNNKNNIKNKKKLGLIVIVVIISIIGLFYINSIFKIPQLDWILTSIKEILALFGIGKENVSSVNTFSLLFKDIQIPKGISLIFGTGLNIFNGTTYRTDIGYLVNLWYGGIVYCLLIYGLMFKFIIIDNIKKNKKLILNITLIIIIFISNIKGNIFNLNGVINLILIYTLSERIITESEV